MQRFIMDEIKKADTIIIHRHSNPDCDALGSQIGLQQALKETFPKKHVYIVGDMNDRVSFMGEMDTIPNSFYKDSLVFILDCPEKKMISDERWELGKKIIKIDHHIFKEKFADYEIVDIDEVSCASIVTDFIFSSGLKLNLKGAEALYTGIVTDSGRFRFGNNLKSTFKACEKLFKFDIDTQKIYQALYLEDRETVLLRSKLMLKVVFDGDTAYLINSYKDFLSYNMPLFVVSRGMIGIMGGIKGIEKWANFTELENGQYIVELRSTKYNVNKLATSFGGGGHKLASGVTLNSYEEVVQLLKELKELKD